LEISPIFSSGFVDDSKTIENSNIGIVEKTTCELHLSMPMKTTLLLTSANAILNNSRRRDGIISKEI